MKRYSLRICQLACFFLIIACQSKNVEKSSTIQTFKEIKLEDITIYNKFDQFEPRISSDRTRPLVVNFWATWCKPCVAELPYFLSLHEKYGDKIDMLLVSLDFPKQVEKKLVPFLNKHQIKPEVVLLADSKQNTWIDKIDPEWSGAIPLTLIIQNGQQSMFEQEFESQQELEDLLVTFIK